MSRKLALSTLLGCVVLSAAAIAQPLDATHPVWPKISDPLPVAGELIMVTVPLSSQASMAGSITISSTTMSNFDILPTSVSYNAGDSSVSFLALIDPFATGSIEITASNESGSASVVEALAAEITTQSASQNSITGAVH